MDHHSSAGKVFALQTWELGLNPQNTFFKKIVNEQKEKTKTKQTIVKTANRAVHTCNSISLGVTCHSA